MASKRSGTSKYPPACHACTGGILRDPALNSIVGGTRMYRHHPTFAALESSASSCPLCTKFRTQVVGREFGRDLFHIGGPKYPLSAKTDRVFHWTGGEFRFTLWQDNLAPEREAKFPTRGFIAKQAIWKSDAVISLEERWPVIQKLIEECDEHTECADTRRQARVKLPSRLIELGEDEEHPPRLVNTVGLDPRGILYATLSHRWGKPEDKPPQTTKGNLQTHGEGIPFDVIPATFSDAMRVARLAGLQYIWIDSLCIVQDDAQDWEFEAARMRDVYEGSYLNIAAIDSPDAKGGCFLDGMKPCVKVSMPDDPEDIVRVRDGIAAHEDVLNSVLIKRGWVSQELMLASRILYCGKGQFYWQCRRYACSEDGALYRVAADGPMNLRSSEGFPGTKQPERNALSRWYKWVANYCELDFTYDTDRAAAMAGVADWFHQHHQLKTTLGCCENEISRNLNWRVSPGASNSSLLSSKFPSWTWLSAGQGRTGFWIGGAEKPYIPCVRVLHMDAQWTGQELVSELLSSNLIVRGLVVKMQTNVYDNIGKDNPVMDVDIERRADVRRAAARFDTHASAAKVEITCPVWMPCLLLGIEHDDPEWATSNSKDWTGELKFLILQELSSAKASAVKKYRRLGGSEFYLDFPSPCPHIGPLEDLFHRHPVDIELV